MKMTYQPKKRHRSKVHGFRKRMSTKGGRKVLAARRLKGRKRLSAQVACIVTFSSIILQLKRSNMNFSESLKKNRDFRNVYQQGKSYANRYLVMYVMNNDLNKNRVGISVSKKIGNSIVRHRITRLIRESYRLNEDKFLCGYDIVIISRIGANGRSFREIESALIHLGNLQRIIDG